MGVGHLSDIRAVSLTPTQSLAALAPKPCERANFQVGLVFAQGWKGQENMLLDQRDPAARKYVSARPTGL